MTDCISLVYAEIEIKLLGPIGGVQFVTKTKQHNNKIDLIDAVYAKKETDLSWLIKSSVICDENKTEQWHGWLYRCDYNNNNIELPWSIGQGEVCDKNQIEQWPDWSQRCRKW